MVKKTGEGEVAGDTLPRREFLKAGVVGALGVAIAGCPTEPLVAEDDAGLRDAPLRDSGIPEPDAASVDAGSDAPASVDPPEATPESETVFPMGVASGDVTPAGAICWTFYTGASALELVVWEMDGARYARTAYTGSVTLNEGFAHLDVSGLGVGAAHRYAFFEVDAGARTGRSAIGRFRTPPPDDALGPLRIGAVSCVSNTRTLETIGHAATREDLSLFAFLGDTTYNDGATTLAAYRTEWRSNLDRPELRALRASTSALATWDDHEFDNDYDPESMPPAQIAAAVRAFFDHQPLRRDGASPDRVWKSVRWGRTVEIFVLDCRNERRPGTRMTPTAEYVSRAQMAWLKTGLAESTATFKLILNSVPISDFPGVFDVQSRDRWEGYAAQRTEILAHIDDQAIRGVLWVAGDFHLASAQRVATSGPGATQIEVLVGPAAQSANPLAFSLGAPQFDFATGDDNYAVLDLDPAAGTVTIQWTSGTGAVLQTRSYVVV